MPDMNAEYRTVVAFSDVITSLHKQAHPDQQPDPLACRRDPCRTLTIRELTSAHYIAGEEQ